VNPSRAIAQQTLLQSRLGNLHDDLDPPVLPPGRRAFAVFGLMNWTIHRDSSSYPSYRYELHFRGMVAVIFGGSKKHGFPVEFEISRSGKSLHSGTETNVIRAKGFIERKIAELASLAAA
jgi:hypothetical protein